MMGYVLALFVDKLTGAGLLEQQSSFLGLVALHLTVFAGGRGAGRGGRVAACTSVYQIHELCRASAPYYSGAAGPASVAECRGRRLPWQK